MKNAKRNLFLCMLLLLGSAFATSGCKDEQPQNTPKKTKPLLGIALYNSDDVYLSMVTAVLQTKLEGKADVIIQGAENNQFTQNAQIDHMLDQKVDALIVNVVEPPSASFLLDKAKKAGIPILFFNREPDPAILRTYDKTCFVGTIPSAAGKMQGDIIKRLWDIHPEYDRNNDGKFQYIMIQANPDNPESVARTEYSIKQAREHGVQMEQLGESLLCEWDQDRAYEAVRTILPMLENSIELIVANNDSTALGAIKALAERGFNTGKSDAKYIPVIGVDATPQAVQAINQGIMSGTVKQDSALMAEVMAKFILNAVEGKNFIEGTGWEWDESGIAVRIPYSPFEGSR